MKRHQLSIVNCQLSIILAAILFLLCSCHYKDLCYDHPHGLDSDIELLLSLKLDMEYDLEVDDETHTKINAPEYMKVDFYNPLSDKLSTTEFVKGGRGQIHVSPGAYKMVAYSFGTEWTQIRGEGDINTLEAFTSDITQQKSRELAKFYKNSTRGADGESVGEGESVEEELPEGPIIYTPDHLLVANKQIEIPSYIPDGIFTIHGDAATIIETYEIDLINIVGERNIASMECFVTNQVRSNFFGRGEKSTEPATIYFPVEVVPNMIGIHAAFNTFGKLPGESRVYMNIIIQNTSGEEVLISEDITTQFTDPTHHIIIDEPIVVPDPEEGGGSGIAPTVDPWDEENHDVPIG